jgi:hypothetical protein
VALVLLLVAAPAAAVSPGTSSGHVEAEHIRSTAAAVFENPSLQTEMPQPGASPDDDRGSRPLLTSRRWHTAPESLEVRPTRTVHASSALLWLTIGAVAIALVAWGISEALIMRGDEQERRSAPESPIDERLQAAGFDLDRARGLAAAGDLASATRCLLGVSLIHLSTIGRVSLKSSTTGREALSQVRGDTALRRHLAVLIVAVEQACFGDLQLTGDDYMRCRTATEAIIGSAGDGS